MAKRSVKRKKKINHGEFLGVSLDKNPVVMLSLGVLVVVLLLFFVLYFSR